MPGQPGETVAIKVLKEELASDPDIVMRFLRERSVLLRLTHPNIVRVRDLVVEGDLLALVMDLVEGPDLHPERPTQGHGYRDDPRPNVVRTIVITHGDPSLEGEVSVEGVYETGIQDQAFLGPESGLAVPAGNAAATSATVVGFGFCAMAESKNPSVNASLGLGPDGIIAK